MKKNSKKIDYSLVEESLNNQAQQISAGIDLVKLKTTKKYRQVVVAGMGGSRLPVEIILNQFADKLLMPVVVVSDYTIAKTLLTKDTLVVAISYSGQTEEVLSVVELVRASGVDLFTVSAGGELAQVKALSNFVFPTDFNPSKQPRYGVGYMIGVLLSLFAQLKIFSLSINEVKKDLADGQSQSIKIKKQLEKIIPLLKSKTPVFVAAEHLSGLLPLMQNQVHETAKNFACHFVLPNLNHHLLEGLLEPKAVTKNLSFIIFTSDLYSARNILRTKITNQVIKKQTVSSFVVKVGGQNKATQVFALLSVCGLLSLGLAKSNKVDPTIVPWVDYFKKALR